MIVLQRTYQQEKLSTWKSLPGKEENIYCICVQNPAATLGVQCEIIPRCHYRRQSWTWTCLLLKYLYFMGPKGPQCLFSLMHISISVTSSKHRNAAADTAAASLSFSSCVCVSLSGVFLAQAVKTAAPGTTPFPWAPGAEGLRTRCGDESRGVEGSGGARLDTEIPKWIGSFGILAKRLWDNEKYKCHKQMRKILLMIARVKHTHSPCGYWQSAMSKIDWSQKIKNRIILIVPCNNSRPCCKYSL